MWTIRNNEDFAELATDKNEVMFRKVRHRKSECIRNNQRTPEIIISGNKVYQIWLTGLILISVAWRRVVRQEWRDLASSWVVVFLGKVLHHMGILTCEKQGTVVVPLLSFSPSLWWQHSPTPYLGNCLFSIPHSLGGAANQSVQLCWVGMLITQAWLTKGSLF